MIATGVHAGNLGAMPYRVEQCNNCGYDYAPIVPWQKFCCTKCRQEYNYDKNRPERIQYQRDYRAYLKSIKPVKRKTTDVTEELQKVRNENAELKKEINELKDLVGNLVDELRKRPVATETPAQTTRAPSSPAANLDDVELEIKQAGTDKDNMSNYNFMIASAINVYGNFDSLPPEIIDYGVRTGRIPPDAVKQKVMETVHVPLGGTQPRHTGNPKEMDVPQFDAPAFDDDADLLEMM